MRDLVVEGFANVEAGQESAVDQLAIALENLATLQTTANTLVQMSEHQVILTFPVKRPLTNKCRFGELGLNDGGHARGISRRTQLGALSSLQEQVLLCKHQEICQLHYNGDHPDPPPLGLLLDLFPRPGQGFQALPDAPCAQ
jgi:hypothetical protein